MSKDYAAYRAALLQELEAQKAERSAELKIAEQQAEAEKQTLAQNKENASRTAYVRQQQGLEQLPEEVTARGENGGAEETGRLRIDSRYRSELAGLNKSFQDASDKIEAETTAKREKTAAQLTRDRENYLAKLTRLAAEEEAALQAAAASAAAAAEKQAAAAQKAAAKQTAAAQKTAQTGNKKTSGGNSTAGAAQTESRLLKMNGQSILFVNGSRVANELVSDGSGRTLLSVGGEAMTPEEAEQGVLDGAVRKLQLANGRTLYQRTSGIGNADATARIQTQQADEQAASGSVLAGLLGYPSIRSMIWSSAQEK